jgi:tetratricopeptide (TPR) repeat protein
MSKLTKTILAITLTLNFIPAYSLEPAEIFAAYYKQAVQAEKKGDSAEAIRMFAKAYEYDKNDAGLMQKLALIYLNNPPARMDDEEAGMKSLAVLNKAQSLEPNNAFIYTLKGQAYERLNRPEESLEAYEAAVEIEPNNTLLKYNLALANFKTKNFKKAIENFNKVIFSYPDHLKARSYLGAALQSTDNYLSALEQYNYVTQYEPNNYTLYKNMGDCWLALGQFEKAEEYFKKAQQIDPKVPNIYADLAFVNSKTQHYDQAIENYSNAIKLKNEPVWHKALAKTFYLKKDYSKAIEAYEYVNDYKMAGFIYQTQGQREKAIANYEKVLKDTPEDTKTLFNLGKLYYAEKRFKESKEIYEKFIKLKPDDSEALFMLAITEQELGNTDAAILHYSELLDDKKLNEDFKNDVRFNLAMAYQKGGDLKKSEDKLQQILDNKQAEDFEKLENLYENLLAVKVNLNKTKEAEKLVEKLLKKHPANLKLRKIYANLLLMKGDNRYAIEQLRFAKTLDDNTTTKLKLAHVLYEEELYYDALHEYQEILKKEPEDIQALLGIANTYKAMNLFVEAQEYYQKAIEFHPKDYLANYNYGLLLKDQNQNQKAKEYFEKVLELKPDFYENYYVLGFVYWDLKQKTKARELWDKFLTSSKDEKLKEEIQKVLGSQASSQAPSSSSFDTDLLPAKEKEQVDEDSYYIEPDAKEPLYKLDIV